MIYRICSILLSRLFVHGILTFSCLILSVRHWITRPAAKASSAQSETSIAWSFILTEAPSRPISERYRYGFKSMICPMLGFSLSLVKNMDIHLTTQNLPSLGGTHSRSCTSLPYHISSVLMPSVPYMQNVKLNSWLGFGVWVLTQTFQPCCEQIPAPPLTRQRGPHAARAII